MSVPLTSYSLTHHQSIDPNKLLGYLQTSKLFLILKSFSAAGYDGNPLIFAQFPAPF